MSSTWKIFFLLGKETILRMRGTYWQGGSRVVLHVFSLHVRVLYLYLFILFLVFTFKLVTYLALRFAV